MTRWDKGLIYHFAIVFYNLDSKLLHMNFTLLWYMHACVEGKKTQWMWKVEMFLFLRKTFNRKTADCPVCSALVSIIVLIHIFSCVQIY